ncbi:MAG: hypothetical protein BroJett024_39910 [Alphaproteobacteria bacterium]|nr:MAG: hypothetical protein BroJett024_39910 [Alphaproteobacteria bacterium]
MKKVVNAKQKPESSITSGMGLWNAVRIRTSALVMTSMANKQPMATTPPTFVTKRQTFMGPPALPEDGPVSLPAGIHGCGIRDHK